MQGLGVVEGVGPVGGVGAGTPVGQVVRVPAAHQHDAGRTQRRQAHRGLCRVALSAGVGLPVAADRRSHAAGGILEPADGTVDVEGGGGEGVGVAEVEHAGAHQPGRRSEQATVLVHLVGGPGRRDLGQLRRLARPPHAQGAAAAERGVQGQVEDEAEAAQHGRVLAQHGQHLVEVDGPTGGDGRDRLGRRLLGVGFHPGGQQLGGHGRLEGLGRRTPCGEVGVGRGRVGGLDVGGLLGRRGHGRGRADDRHPDRDDRERAEQRRPDRGIGLVHRVGRVGAGGAAGDVDLDLEGGVSEGGRPVRERRGRDRVGGVELGHHDHAQDRGAGGGRPWDRDQDQAAHAGSKALRYFCQSGSEGGGTEIDDEGGIAAGSEPPMKV